MQNQNLRWAVALFFALAIPATSHAQLGGLGKKIKTAAKTTVKTVGDVDVKVNTGTSTTTTTAPAATSTTTAPTSGASQTASASETSIYGETWQLASYNHGTKQFKFTERKYEAGDHAGQPVTYTYDETTGVVRDIDGTLKGTISKDCVDVPGIGKVSIINERGTLSLDGTTSIGRVTTYDFTCYGSKMGTFGKNEPRELVAFFFLSELAGSGKMETLKKNYESRQQRQAQAAAAFKEKLKNVTAGSFQDLAGNKLGSITADGKVLNKLGSQIGLVKVNGSNTEVYDALNHRLGYITDTGNVCKGTANEKVGQLQSSGTIDSSVGSKLGSINGNDFYDSKSNRIGSFSGKGVYVAAALRFFFFSF